MMKKIIQFMLLFFNIIMLFTLVFSLLSPFVNPNLFWPISFFGLFFPIILFVILLLFIYSIFYNKKLMWINLVFILISSPYLIRYISLNKENKTEEGIHIMSYNVRLFNKWGWIKEDDIDRKIIHFVNNKKVDIFCIQEYYNPNDKLNFNFNDSHIGLQKNKDNWRMAIYSNYPQINKQTVNIDGARMNNTCIFSDIKIDKDTIRVYNIHLASNFFQSRDFEFMTSTELEKEKIKNGVIGVVKRLKKSFKNRGKEVEQIKEHMRKSPYPIIVCGDFNDTPVSYAYRELSENKKDAFIESGNGIGATFTKIPSLRIDYIFYDKKFNSSQFNTHQENFSDHRAISCKVKLN